MTTIVLRVDNPNGLTNAQIDANFINLNNDKVETSNCTPINLGNTVVKRDSFGDFAARNITANDVIINGNITVNGTTTTVNAATVSVADINIELGKVSTPTDATANGGGFTLKGATDKTFNWIASTTAWTSSEHIALAAGKSQIFYGSTSGSVTVKPVSVAGSTTITLPATNGTVITSGDTGTVTNAMLAGSIATSKLANSTISGISLGSNLATLTIGTGLSGASYNGSSAVTIALANTGVAAGSYTTANITIDAQGRITAASSGVSGLTLTDDSVTDATYYPVVATTAGGSTGKTSSLNLTFNPSTGTLSSTVFNSLSDADKKINIELIPDALSIVENLRGVKFDWKDNGNPSAGLIAQDVEKYLPQLINTSENAKTLNYNGIIGVLVEAVKELSQKVKELQSK